MKLLVQWMPTAQASPGPVADTASSSYPPPGMSARLHAVPSQCSTSGTVIARPGCRHPRERAPGPDIGSRRLGAIKRRAGRRRRRPWPGQNAQAPAHHQRSRQPRHPPRTPAPTHGSHPSPLQAPYSGPVFRFRASGASRGTPASRGGHTVRCAAETALKWRTARPRWPTRDHGCCRTAGGCITNPKSVTSPPATAAS